MNTAQRSYEHQVRLIHFDINNWDFYPDKDINPGSVQTLEQIIDQALWLNNMMKEGFLAFCVKVFFISSSKSE